MKVQYRWLLIVATVYMLTLYLIYNRAPILTGDVDINIAQSRNVTAVPDVLVGDVFKLQWSPKDKVFFKKVRSGAATPTEGAHAVQCNGGVSGAPDTHKFVEISDGMHIYSIYYDDRMATRFIRMIGTLRTFKGKVEPRILANKLCMFTVNETRNDTSYISVKMSFYEMCENHKRVYGGWIFSCEVPSQVTEIPTSVRIFAGAGNLANLSHSRELCVKSFERRTERRKLKYGVCVPPIYGDIRPKDLIQFIELHRLLGAEQFIFYVEVSDTPVRPDLHKILKYYSRQRVAYLVQWQLPVPAERIWYHGQSLAINDCLYRHMNDYHYLAFVDLDEFIIPQKSLTTWDDVMDHMRHIDDNSFSHASAFSFKSAYFSEEFSRRVLSSELETHVRTNRTLYFSYRRHKVIVRPDRIFELGIHHVSRSWPDANNYTVVAVPSNVAFIHHYRQCVREFGVHCNNVVQDFSILSKFGKQLKDNYYRTLYDIT